MMINPQQWKQWKIMSIIPFILVINFLFFFTNSINLCLHVLTVITIYWMTLIGIILANNCLSCACYTLDLIILSSFVLLTTEEYSLKSSYYLYSYYLSKFLQNCRCQIIDSFHRHHLHNILYVEMVETFLFFLFFRRNWRIPLRYFLELNVSGIVFSLESKELVFPFPYFW